MIEDTATREVDVERADNGHDNSYSVTMWTDATFTYGSAYIAIVIEVGGKIVGAATERVTASHTAQAELTSILRAVQIAAVLSIKSVTIYNDAQGAVAQANPGACATPLDDQQTAAIQASLFALLPGFDTCKIQWIPRRENLAHRVARDARNSDSQGDPIFGAPLGHNEIQLRLRLPSPPGPRSA